MAYELGPGEVVTNTILPAGPPAHQEVWQEMVNLLEQNPAAYVLTDTFAEPLSGTIGLRTLWQFWSYNPNDNDWSHIAVQGNSPMSSSPIEVIKALRHVHGVEELTSSEKRVGLLGVKATKFCGITAHFPDAKLLDTVKSILPQQVRQLTVQTRQGVKGEDQQALRSVLPTNLVVRLDHPSKKSGL
jgi:hypothetical protein